MSRALASLAAALLLPAAVSAQPNRADAARFGWLTNYAAALKEAKRTGKPILLVFRCEP